MSNPSQSIIILGAGVFGLSTALHLARRGYKDVLVLDRQPYDQNLYAPDKGCDGASADINKVFRTTYGDRKIYQDLALRCLSIWGSWTRSLQSSDPALLPPGLSPTDEILSESGFMRVGQGKAMSAFHQSCLDGVEADGRRGRVFVLNDEADLQRARAADTLADADDEVEDMHWSDKLSRFNGLMEGDIHGFLDMDAGFTRADKACQWALHLCKQAGVKFILHPVQGCFDGFIESGCVLNQRVLGVSTKDGVEHRADKVIVACGGWTPSIVPATASLLETTGGSVAYVDLPPERTDLWDKFGPDQFCTWSFQSSEGTGMGGFGRLPLLHNTGRLKFGYRAKKYTNYEDHPLTKTRLSVPKTAYSADPITNIPLEALETIKGVIRAVYPELTEIGITGFRMCWYTDSIDNHFVADYVPGTSETLFVASGGSGHGFKFLPLLGEHFLNQLEKRPDEFTPYWKWRSPVPGQGANGLEEGERGPRVLGRVPMATKEDWKFQMIGAGRVIGQDAPGNLA
ncbi:hypothetical protein EHS25_003192 [Saitozyma podzolica]|uniref:FAD dependent oxidoreductase domain-containing protein n=1 Tax=Saitozyma podzolica TaxID=1890683 RepID=A0A427Y892_9TREE|nr:hypothetical protein EHS25_003192 [Saitozyma podzolica]